MERYRIHAEAAVYYLTYAIVEWLPVFVSQKTCAVVADSLGFCCRQKQLRINAFVIMPTHLHLIAFDADFDAKLAARTLTDFRKFTGRQLSDHCCKNGPKCFSQVLRDEAVADRERRFWQPSRHPEAVIGDAFGNRNSIISMTTRAVRAWFAVRIIGAILPRLGICRRGCKRLMCR